MRHILSAVFALLLAGRWSMTSAKGGVRADAPGRTNPPFPPGTSVSSHQPTTNVIFPVITGSTDSGGWAYFNLNAAPAHASQGWVTVSMFAEGQFGVEYDATTLGNGCSPPAGPSDTTQIGPAH